MLSAEIIREQRVKAEKAQFIVFSLLYIISCISYAFYIWNYPVMYSLSERESGSKHARNCVYLSKIENSAYRQELDL